MFCSDDNIMHHCPVHQSTLILFHLLFAAPVQRIDQTKKHGASNEGTVVEPSRLSAVLIHFTLLTTVATPVCLQQPLFSHDKDSLSPPRPSWLELLPYVAFVSTHCIPTVGQTLRLMPFLLKESAATTGLCEFWHSGCLPGNVPSRFCVCCSGPIGFADVSCWFSVILSHVIAVQFLHKAGVLSQI